MLSAACSGLPVHASLAGCKNCCQQAISPRPCSCSSSLLLQASPKSNCRTKATMEETCSVALQPRPAPAVQPAIERRPAFHLAPAGGWINDPNGPLLHNGTYHLFYQHVPGSSDWQWGLVWGHAKSGDLVNWEHLPVALEPTPHGLDQHGCFSGCATVDVDGRPALLYTGVIRKAPDEIQPDVSPQHEYQLLAVATDLDDPDLTNWQKLPGNFLPRPSGELTGWRDPFVLEKPSAASPWWYVMVGAGVRSRCGTAMVYRSLSLTEGWQFVGPLCEDPASHMWECPIMAHLSSVPLSPDHQQQQQRGRHMLSVSPDYCVNMIQYWLGDYAEGRFDLEGADGPFPLDLGDIMYAPNVLTDKQGRTVLWAWMQEKAHLRPAGDYSSACCLCLPRVLSLSADGSRLQQAPLPELSQLRQQQGAWHAGGAAAAAATDSGKGSSGVSLLPGQRLRIGEGLPGAFNSSSVDVELTVARGQADSFALLLHPFVGGAAGAAGAALTYCWSTNTLQVVYSTDFAALERVAALPLPPRAHYKQPGPDPVQLAEQEAAAAAQLGVPARCGGPLRPLGQGASVGASAGASACASGSVAEGASAGVSTGASEGVSVGPAGGCDGVISLRVLLDGSCLEVFTSTGEALGTRVYRGDLLAPTAAATTATTAAAAAAGQHAQHGAVGVGSGADPTAAAMAAAAAAGAVGWEELFSSSSSSSSSGGASGAAAAQVGGQLELVAFGPGPATLLRGSAWQMSSMWLKQQQQQQQQQSELPAPLAAAAATAAAAEVLVATEAAAVAAATAAAAAASPVVLPVRGLLLDVGVAAAGAGGVAELLPLSPSGAGGSQPVQVEAA